MKVILNPVQIHVLRRCAGVLRVWETGHDRSELLIHVEVLVELGMVKFDDARGYETTPAGEHWLVKFDG